MLEGLAAAGELRWFHLYLLSDTSEARHRQRRRKQTAAALSAQFGAGAAGHLPPPRTQHGFKAGNIRDFCERWGDRHPFAIVLDADSVMSPAGHAASGADHAGLSAHRHPADARHRTAQRQCRSRGSSSSACGWACAPTRWVPPAGRAIAGRTGGTTPSCGWRPFIEHCDLPVLPGTPPLGGHVLSHDQVEAVLMRRAGYEVRVLPVEDGSWEENPPSLLEFIRRDLRWCQGNMQYLKPAGHARSAAA
jgi:membrane glycosyltransferase